MDAYRLWINKIGWFLMGWLLVPGIMSAQEVLTKSELPEDKRMNYYKKAEAFLKDYYNTLPDTWNSDISVWNSFINHYMAVNAMLIPETPQGTQSKEFLDANRYLLTMKRSYGSAGKYTFHVDKVEYHPDIHKSSLFACVVRLEYMLYIYKDGKRLSAGRKVASLEFPDRRAYFNVKLKQLEPNTGRSIMLERYQSPEGDEEDDKMPPEQVAATYNLALTYYWDTEAGISEEEYEYRRNESYVMFQFPKTTGGDRMKAFEFFKKAAEQEHGKAMMYLGKYYRTGRYVRKDLEKAVFWLEKASRTNAIACYELAKCYMELGRCAEAVPLFKRAAEEVLFNYACVHLQDIYKNGCKGVAPSKEQYEYWSEQNKALKELREAVTTVKPKDSWAYLD